MNRRVVSACVALLGVLAAGGCDFGIRLSGSPPGTPTGGHVAAPAPSASASAVADADPLGPAPELAAPRAFEPRPPEVFQGPNGLTVWLVERPDLPLVAATFVTPYGAAADPSERPGTMYLVADMLDEGAGARSAIEVSDTIASLGASLSTYATADGTFASVASLKGKFDVAFGVLCDVVKAPRFEGKDFTRVKKLYKNALKKRLSDPESVAASVTMRELYGDDSAYGHPISGYLSKADLLDVGGVKTAWERTFRPDRLTLVVVGQITRPEIEKALGTNLADWKPKGEAAPAPKSGAVKSERPRMVLVDRPKAVQTVVVVAREGVAASDGQAAHLQLVNAALGGSFTSRLNLNLREQKNWTYGAGSTFTMSRGQGAFFVRTSVEAQYTGRAVKEILNELTLISDQGLTDVEVTKVKALDRADLVETYETGSATAGRLASLVAAGLPPLFDAAASRLRQNSTGPELARLAKEHLAPGPMTIVLVGDRTTIEQQLTAEGLGVPELRGPEGQKLGGDAKPKDATPKPKDATPKPKPKDATPKPKDATPKPKK